MSESILALTLPASRAQLDAARDPQRFEIQYASGSGDALALLPEHPQCRLVLVERDAEPQLQPFVQRLRRLVPGIEVLLWSPQVADPVRAAMQALGVEWVDRALSPVDLRQLLVHRFERASLKARAGIVGRSPRIHEILATLIQIGPTDIPVLLTGPSGAGKELFARALVLASRRSERPFVAVNVGALAESVLESELFGHEKGAFTGAVARKEGVFERAHGGTLFLDEVGEMSAHMQVRLLRALDLGEITPVGGNRSIQIDARVVAATNRDLESEVRAGRFREDLYYRLRVVPVRVPALSERREDIPDLVQHFLLESARLYGTPVRKVSEAAMQALVAYAWPGNVRELRNVVQGLAVLAPNAAILPADLPPSLQSVDGTLLPALAGRTAEQAERDVILQSLLALRRDLQEILSLLRGPLVPSGAVLVDSAGADTPAPVSLREVERSQIEAALHAAAGNRRLAAGRLGVSERTLYRKLKEFGLR
jgi:DNA-binding NtrC family response regulator